MTQVKDTSLRFLLDARIWHLSHRCSVPCSSSRLWDRPTWMANNDLTKAFDFFIRQESDLFEGSDTLFLYKGLSRMLRETDADHDRSHNRDIHVEKRRSHKSSAILLRSELAQDPELFEECNHGKNNQRASDVSHLLDRCQYIAALYILPRTDVYGMRVSTG
jgi:hypothetical protein